jgi:hypothetical protein
MGKGDVGGDEAYSRWIVDGAAFESDVGYPNVLIKLRNSAASLCMCKRL